MALNIFEAGDAILNYHKICSDNNMSKPILSIMLYSLVDAWSFPSNE